MKIFITLLFVAGLTLNMMGQEVKLNTNMAVEADGTVRMDGAATTWEDLRVDLNNGSAGTTIGYMPGESTGGQIYYFVDGANPDAMSFSVQLPHAWKEGTTVYPHVHWIPNNTSTGDVQWNLDYSWQNYVSGATVAFPVKTTSTVVATIATNSYRHHLITALTEGNAGLDGTGKKISSMIVCRIWRNASAGNAADTYAGNVGGLFVDFHYQSDTYGSRQEYIK
ncbi:MAG: hypothetical protein HOO86_07040 [Bacteroidales bacterium]|nr:hypothetical protein [Bacteroidales bacterium]